MTTYQNLKDQVVDYVNGYGQEHDELVEKIEEAYRFGEIDGHEYDDLMQYMED